MIRINKAEFFAFSMPDSISYGLISIGIPLDLILNLNLFNIYRKSKNIF
jgi:hypothetical protein